MVDGTSYLASYKVENGTVTVQYSGLKRSGPLGNLTEVAAAQALLQQLVKIGPNQ